MLVVTPLSVDNTTGNASASGGRRTGAADPDCGSTSKTDEDGPELDSLYVFPEVTIGIALMVAIPRLHLTNMLGMGYSHQRSKCWNPRSSDTCLVWLLDWSTSWLLIWDACTGYINLPKAISWCFLFTFTNLYQNSHPNVSGQKSLQYPPYVQLWNVVYAARLPIHQTWFQYVQITDVTFVNTCQYHLFTCWYVIWIYQTEPAITRQMSQHFTYDSFGMWVCLENMRMLTNIATIGIQQAEPLKRS